MNSRPNFGGLSVIGIAGLVLLSSACSDNSDAKDTETSDSNGSSGGSGGSGFGSITHFPGTSPASTKPVTKPDQTGSLDAGPGTDPIPKPEPSGTVTAGGDPNYPDKGDFVFDWVPARGFEAEETWSQGHFASQGAELSAALKLPYDIAITHQACGEQNAYWDGEGVNMCYELIDTVFQAFSTVAETEEALDSLSASTWKFILYHELGHGLIDTYELPVPGREEDAVDGFSAALLIDSGQADAVIAAAIFWKISSATPGNMPDFADEHSWDEQRFYNLLCWVYGSSPADFAFIGDEFPELRPRLPKCPSDYAQQITAWSKLLAPYLKG